MKKLLVAILGIYVPLTFADGNVNATYINSSAFIQDPYISLTSGGGLRSISESQVATQNAAQKLFNDGTWNVYGTAVAQYSGSSALVAPNYGYGANVFGQTGQLDGFSVGGLFTIQNPWGATNMNGAYTENGLFIPSNSEVNMTEAFLEYQHSNIVQADIGLIGINNSPWLAPNYIGNMAAPLATYQGALVNIHPGGGWLITALGFNAANLIGENGGFTGRTLYNKSYSVGGVFLPTTKSDTSNGTVALGANYSAWNNNYNFRLWGYQFDNYGTLLYGDTSIKFNPVEDLGFSVALQGGTDNSMTGGNNSNAFSNPADQLQPTGQISSSFAGVQGGLTYKWLGVNLAYNTIWANQNNSWGSGAVISPYTYGAATDPLYSTPYMMGLVDMGTGGSAYKISVPLTFLSGNMTISPAFTQFYTNPNSPFYGTKEYDLTVNYAVPQVKGLNLFAAYAYQSVPFASQGSGSGLPGSSYVTQLFASYLY